MSGNASDSGWEIWQETQFAGDYDTLGEALRALRDRIPPNAEGAGQEGGIFEEVRIDQIRDGQCVRVIRHDELRSLLEEVAKGAKGPRSDRNAWWLWFEEKSLDGYPTLKEAIAGIREWSGGGALDSFRLEYYEDDKRRLTVPEEDVRRLLEDWQ